MQTVLSLSGVAMALGWIWVVAHAIAAKSWKQALLSALVPFYPFAYVLRLPETRVKKFMAILTMGAFLLFAAVSVLKALLAPPEF